MDYRDLLASVIALGLLLTAAVGCSSKSAGADAAGGGAPSGSAGNGAQSGGTTPDPGGTYNGPTMTYDSGMETVGQLTAAPSTKLPELPILTNVVALQGGDGASISFDPVDGALDYRVYPLPDDGDLTVAGDNSIVVHNGTYRCAGNREAPPVYA